MRLLLRTLCLLAVMCATSAAAWQVEPNTGEILPGNRLQAAPDGKLVPDYGKGLEVGPQGQPLPRVDQDWLDREIARLRRLDEATRP